MEKWASVVLASEKLSRGPKRRDPIDCFGRYSTKTGTKKNTMRTQFESCWGEKMCELEMSKRRPLFYLHNWRQNYLCAQSCFPHLSPEELIALGGEQNRKFEF